MPMFYDQDDNAPSMTDTLIDEIERYLAGELSDDEYE